MSDEALFEVTEKSARISDDGRYRYSLGRRWGGRPAAVFVMLNPSTADANVDDPTIVRCRGFAEREGCGSLTAVNLYAYRATKPENMWLAALAGADIVGTDNDDTLRDAFRAAARDGGPVIAAWGANAHADRVEFVAALAAAAGVQLHALGVTKAGQPRHPLYLRADTPLTRWENPR